MSANILSFGLGGIIVPSGAVALISARVVHLCKRWGVPALHGNKIRGGKGKFGFLKSDEARKMRFFAELEEIIIDPSIVAHACVICRPGYRDRYQDQYPEASRWQLSRTAFDIAVERAAKFARLSERKLSVVYERSGKKEDRLIETYFAGLKLNGTAFDAGKAGVHRPLVQSDLAATLLSIRADEKTNPMLQLADLVLHPLCHRTTGLPNRAFDRLQSAGRLLDAHGEGDPAIAIKYSCYDGQYRFWSDA